MIDGLQNVFTRFCWSKASVVLKGDCYSPYVVGFQKVVGAWLTDDVGQEVG